MKRYFNWLQKGVPTGELEHLPKLTDNNETSIPGIYCIGDLTGVPLIKTALNSGHDLLSYLLKDKSFQDDIKKRNDDFFDIVIVGAGPSGLSAAIKAKEAGLRYILLESSNELNTLRNFPSGKPIFNNPSDISFSTKLKFSDGTKETLIDELKDVLDSEKLNILNDHSVSSVSGSKGNFEVHTKNEIFRALRVIIAIGKSGNARKLKVPGEEFDKVLNNLIDPEKFSGKNILVVGGGDSAIETAVALANENNKVYVSYRKKTFSRPKEENLKAFEELAKTGKIIPKFSTTVSEIKKDSVLLNNSSGKETIENDYVFVLIGREIPLKFFKRSKIKIEGEQSLFNKFELIALLSFFVMLYFGKAGVAVKAWDSSDTLQLKVLKWITAPFNVELNWSTLHHSWLGSLNFVIGWLGSVSFVIFGILSIINIFIERKERLSSAWNIFKNSYLFFVAFSFLYIYLFSVYTKDSLWVEPPTFWYSAFYSLTIFIFGLRRIFLKPTGYVIRQTLTLIFIQTFFLFLLPFFLYDSLVVKLFPATVLRELFPAGKWSSFGFILFWPLNMANFGTSFFWTIFPFVQTFIILPALIYRYGKGVYCGWICSCGGMAETFGNEYRTLAPHGTKAKKLENIGQFVLLFAIILTIVKSFVSVGIFTETMSAVYKISIDIIFAGVLGLGLYFFYSGRIWCRYGCPLAALMHIYTRFSKYRIVSDKSRCISCGICTKNCHMGIDVRSYAAKGIPMNDVECVACSSCMITCPMDVLKFGSVVQSNPTNDIYKSEGFKENIGWMNGAK